MKIISIVRSQTRPRSIALRTEPLLTKDVFHKFKNRFDDTTMFSFKDDLLFVEQTSLPKAEIEHYNQLLTDAEQMVKRHDADAENECEDFLNALASESGLPLD
jgi:hypothetical protein